MEEGADGTANKAVETGPPATGAQAVVGTAQNVSVGVGGAVDGNGNGNGLPRAQIARWLASSLIATFCVQAVTVFTSIWLPGEAQQVWGLLQKVLDAVATAQVGLITGLFGFLRGSNGH